MKTNVLLYAMIIVLAVVLRSVNLDYALTDVCIAPTEEYWLYNPYPYISAYAWNVQPSARDDVQQWAGYGQRVFANTSVDLWILRYMGVLSGALVVALSLGVARHFQHRSGVLIGVFVAVGSWFVLSDQWAIRYDFALPCVAWAIWTLSNWRKRPIPTWRVWSYEICAVGLWLVAPPLWWLSLVLIALAPQRHVRHLVFLALIGVVLFPALRSPFQWLESAQQWDISLTATMVWLGMILVLWRWKQFTVSMCVLAWMGIVLFIAVALSNRFTRVVPTATEWRMVHDVQNQLADDSLLELDKATQHLANVITCPMGANLHVQTRGENSILSTRPYDYKLTTTPPIANDQHLTDLGDGYFLARHVSLPNPVNLPIGDQLRFLGYQLVTPDVMTEQVVDVRLDFQLSDMLNEEITVYGGFVHITLPNQPAEKVYEMTFPLTDILGQLERRSNQFNRHIRFSVPSRTPAGTYDVIFGVVQYVEGREVGRLIVGQLIVR